MYDFDDETWSELHINYQPSRHNTSVVFGNDVYVIGGNVSSKGQSLDNIQRFTLWRIKIHLWKWTGLIGYKVLQAHRPRNGSRLYLALCVFT